MAVEGHRGTVHEVAQELSVLFVDLRSEAPRSCRGASCPPSRRNLPVPGAPNRGSGRCDRCCPSGRRRRPGSCRDRAPGLRRRIVRPRRRSRMSFQIRLPSGPRSRLRSSGSEAEARGDLVQGLFQTHEGEAELLDLFVREGAGLHAADGLLLHQLAQELGVARSRRATERCTSSGSAFQRGGLGGGAPLDLGAQGVQLFRSPDERRPAGSWHSFRREGVGRPGPVALSRRPPMWPRASSTSREVGGGALREARGDRRCRGADRWHSARSSPPAAGDGARRSGGPISGRLLNVSCSWRRASR